jgi:hypothetical protein
LPLTEAAFTPHLARVVAGEEEDGNPLRSVADEEADGNPMRDTLLNMRGDYIQHAHTIYLGTDDAVQLLVPIRNGVTEIQSLHGIMGSKVLPGHERKQLAISLVGLLQQINYPEHVSYARSTFDDLLFFRTQDGNFEVKYIPEVSITAYVYSQTNTTVAGGIIRLYAPEVWQGDVEQAPADIFSLGLILYPLLTGRSYAPTYQPKQLATAIRSGSAARAIINEVPELKDVFAALLAMNPADRFMDPAQIIQAINDYQD